MLFIDMIYMDEWELLCYFEIINLLVACPNKQNDYILIYVNFLKSDLQQAICLYLIIFFGIHTAAFYHGNKILANNGNLDTL